MYQPYFDLRGRLGEPLWHDWQGVPRYDPYKPGEQDVYAKYDCLLEIECQACRQRFFVGACTEAFAWDTAGEPTPVRLPTSGDPSFATFGDAPWHEDEHGMCAGTTMSSVLIRIVEFWERADPPQFSWRRRPSLEIVFGR